MIVSGEAVNTERRDQREDESAVSPLESRDQKALDYIISG